MDTFLDYSQSVAREFGLGLEELALLHYFVKTLGDTKILKCSIDGEVYFNVNYGKIISENPIFTFGKRMVALKFGNLVNAGVLIHTTYKQGGTYSMYGFGKNYARLLSKEDETKSGCATAEKSVVGGSQKIDKGVDNKFTTPSQKIDNGSQKIDEGVVNKLTRGSQKIDELNIIYNNNIDNKIDNDIDDNIYSIMENIIDNNMNNNNDNNKEENNNNNKNNIFYCSELQNSSEPEATQTSEKPFISLILNTKELYPVYKTDINKWKELYPAVDVEQELRKMCGWCEGNPSKRKTKGGIQSFIHKWLAKAQDKVGNTGFRPTVEKTAVAQKAVTQNNNKTELSEKFSAEKQSGKLESIPDESLEGFSKPMKAALMDWFDYKSGNNQAYKEIGWKNAIMQVKKYIDKYGDEAVENRIRNSIGSGYQGMNLEILDKNNGDSRNNNNAGGKTDAQRADEDLLRNNPKEYYRIHGLGIYL